MKTAKELNDDILKITLLIQEKHPELSKFIGEMPVTNPDVKSPKMNVQHLQNYYDSLQELIKKYVVNHDLAIKMEE